ncbi:hypothetical protein [Bifidobacterium sp. ESL0764]|uniref:hypothetical protein n=1 Tax=Bifidobacterium sp. ESL0764 TaxID=2983228 RepID=UPI0023F9C881|nr:hypothetical protein [Bifidobacterium sp. ESL0764]WEV65013.1 hypothetical protein OZX71_04270 [Bifidobacterium sp. ESL0764]
MPWWGWIIVAVVMLAALAVGLVYAGIHAVRAAHSVAGTGKEIQNYLNAMQQTDPGNAAKEKPLFTQPLSTAAHRYSLAQTEVERRRITRHNRHAERWSVWKHNRVPFTANPTPVSNQTIPQSTDRTFSAIVENAGATASEGLPIDTGQKISRSN